MSTSTSCSLVSMRLARSRQRGCGQAGRRPGGSRPRQRCVGRARRGPEHCASSERGSAARSAVAEALRGRIAQSRRERRLDLSGGPTTSATTAHFSPRSMYLSLPASRPAPWPRSRSSRWINPVDLKTSGKMNIAHRCAVCLRRARARCRAPGGSAQFCTRGAPCARESAPSAIDMAVRNAFDMRNNLSLETFKP